MLRRDSARETGGESLGWVGLEPTTNALKGRCSTIELPTRGGPFVLVHFRSGRKGTARCTRSARAYHRRGDLGVVTSFQDEIAQRVLRPVQFENRDVRADGSLPIAHWIVANMKRFLRGDIV